jgi:hypothetical protein
MNISSHHMVASEMTAARIESLDYVKSVEVGHTHGSKRLATIIVDSKSRLTYSNLAELFGIVVQIFGEQDEATVEIGIQCVAFVGVELKPKVTARVEVLYVY